MLKDLFKIVLGASILCPPFILSFFLFHFFISKTEFGKQINKKPIYKYSFIMVVGILLIITMFLIWINTVTFDRG